MKYGRLQGSFFLSVVYCHGLLYGKEMKSLPNMICNIPHNVMSHSTYATPADLQKKCSLHNNWLDDVTTTGLKIKSYLTSSNVIASSFRGAVGILEDKLKLGLLINIK